MDFIVTGKIYEQRKPGANKMVSPGGRQVTGDRWPLVEMPVLDGVRLQIRWSAMDKPHNLPLLTPLQSFGHVPLSPSIPNPPFVEQILSVSEKKTSTYRCTYEP